jgi:hypothetical protein
MGEVNNNNQLAMEASKVVGGWRVSIKDHTTTMVSKDEQQECAAVDEGSNKEGESSKGDGDGDEGGGQQRGQGRQGQWRW